MALNPGDRDRPTARASVARPLRQWYPAAPSADVDGKPVGATLFGVPIVVFRDGGGVARVLRDRCPHRNAPLSAGRVHPSGSLECGYHGWRFDGAGRCVAVPGLDPSASCDVDNRAVTSHPTLEQDGFVWMWGDPETTPVGAPPLMPDLGPGSAQTIFSCDMDCTLHAALENALDVPHTAFLHRGIFRGAADPKPIEAHRREIPGGVEVRFEGEPVSFAGITPGGGLTFEHWDRFLMPSIAQIEYRIDGWARIVNNIVHLPLDDNRTRAWFVLRWWSRLPTPIVRPIVRLRGRQILRQDADMLAAQRTTIDRFGGERYTSTDLDLLGGAIWRMLRAAERAESGSGSGPANGDGENDDPDDLERTVTIRV